MKTKTNNSVCDRSESYVLNSCKSILQPVQRLFQYETLTAFALVLTISFEAAALRCDAIFERLTPLVVAETVPAPNKTKASSNRAAIEKYKANSTVLKKISQNLPEVRKEYIEHLITATEFYDYNHFSDKLISNFLAEKSQKVDFTNLYGEQSFLGDNSRPFDGFVSARKFLSTYNKEINLELIQSIHKLVMADNVEGVTREDLGDLRDGHWYGNVSPTSSITAAERINISENPYLTFEETGTTPSPLKNNTWKNINYWGKKAALEPIEATMYLGRINYPNILNSKQATIDIIKNTHPELHAAINKTRESKGPTPRYFEGSDLQIQEGQLTKALTENRIAKFNSDAAKLGKVKIGVNEKDYIHLVADFQRDLVSIHPVKDGNGRTTRLLMNHLLARAGLPPARILNPSMDIQKSQTEWQKIVYQGVTNSAKLYADFKERIQHGLALEHSPELLFPGLAETVEINFKKQGSDKVYLGSEPIKVNSEQFSAFLKELVKANPELKKQIENDRVRAMNNIADMFVDFYKSKTIEYMHEKDGRSVIKLRFVESDFVDTFGVVRSVHKHLWKYKMDRWYDQDMMIWRGLSGKTEVTEAEILNYFVQPSDRIASNAAVNGLRSGKNITQLMKVDFNKYNQELLNGKLIEMALDHHKEGPRYSTSYGFSTSKREVVGKAFAMGAMVIAEYGKQNDPELQKQLKSRINIASYRAEKDVDLGRLKAFDPEFSYIYGRQAEVMAIGGTDPDAVMIIQRIGSTGEVERTYFRNPEQPNEVLVIKGRYVPEMGALAAEQITSKHFINIDPVSNKISVNETAHIASETYIQNSKFTPEVKSTAEKKSAVDQLADWMKNLF
jgi:hypothetical protein